MDIFILLLGIILICNSATARGPPKINRNIFEPFVVYVEGTGLKLPCPVDGDPEPMIEWSKEEIPINSAWTRFKTLPRGHLKARALQVEDSGSYVCKATNGFGTISVQIHLFVRPDTNDTVTFPPGWGDENAYLRQTIGELPYFTNPSKMNPIRIMQPMGSTVELQCKARGMPTPSIQWYKEGRQIQTKSLDVGADGQQWTLRIRDLVAGDSGSYRCHVHNDVGSINHTYHLEVVDDLAASIPEVLALYPQNGTVLQNDLIVFHCEVKSSSEPKIKWLKVIDESAATEHVNSSFNVNNQNYIVLPNADHVWRLSEGTYKTKLTLHRVTAKDAGVYICWAANSVGYAIKRTHLSVRPAGGGYLSDLVSTDSSSGFPLLPVIIAGSVVFAILFIVMVVFIVRSQNKKAETPNKKLPVKAATNPRPANYSSVSSEKRCYEYQAVQGYSSAHGPQHELLHPDSSVSDASTPHKYASLHTSNTSPSPNMMHPMMPNHQQSSPHHPQQQPPPQQQPSGQGPVMHMQHNPMMHSHQHVHPSHAAMMAYPGHNIHPASQDHPLGYIPAPMGHDYDMDGPYMSEYNRPPSPTTHVVYKSC